MKPKNALLTLTVVLLTPAVLMMMLALGGCGGGDETTNDTFVQAKSDASAGDTCDAYCAAIISASCPSGPPTEAACKTNCNTMRTGVCKAEWDAALGCAGSSPQAICVAGKPTIKGCEAAVAAISGCKQTLPDAGSK